MAGPGNTPYQVGPGGETGVTIPGNVGFYGGTPVAKQTVTALAAQTTNVTTQMTTMHATLSTLVVGLRTTGLITTA